MSRFILSRVRYRCIKPVCTAEMKMKLEVQYRNQAFQERRYLLSLRYVNRSSPGS